MLLGVLGGDQSDNERIEPHFGCPLDGQAGDEVGEAGLRRSVDRASGARPGAADRADHDDRAAAGLGLHDRVGPLGDVQRRQQVQLDDAGGDPRRRGGRLEAGSAAGVVHDDVEPAETLSGGVDHHRSGFRLTDVSEDEAGGASAGRGKLVGFMACAHHYLSAGGEKSFGNTATDSAHPAGHEYAASCIVDAAGGCHGLVRYQASAWARRVVLP